MWAVCVALWAETFAQSSTQSTAQQKPPQADLSFEFGMTAMEQQDFRTAVWRFREAIMAGGETPKFVRSLAKAIFYASNTNRDSVRLAQVLLNQYFQAGADNKRRLMEILAASMDKRLQELLRDSINAANAPARSASISADQEAANVLYDRYDLRLRYLPEWQKRWNGAVSLWGSAGLTLQPSDTLDFFWRAGVEGRYVFWLTDDNAFADVGVDVGLRLMYGSTVNRAQSNIALRRVYEGEFSLRLHVGVFGVIVQSALQNVHYSRIHDNGETVRLFDGLNTGTRYNLTGIGAFIEPRFGQSGLLAQAQWKPLSLVGYQQKASGYSAALGWATGWFNIWAEYHATRYDVESPAEHSAPAFPKSIQTRQYLVSLQLYYFR